MNKSLLLYIYQSYDMVICINFIDKFQLILIHFIASLNKKHVVTCKEFISLITWNNLGEKSSSNRIYFLKPSA